MTIEDQSTKAEPRAHLLSGGETSADLSRALRAAGYEVTIASIRSPLPIPRDAVVTVIDLRGTRSDAASAILRDSSIWVTPVLAVTDPHQTEVRVLGLQLGVTDDAVSPITAAEMRARIDRCTRRRGAVSAGMLGDVTLERVGRRVRRGDATAHLTRREFEILHALAAHAGTVVSKQMLLDEVWGRGTQPGTTNAVEAHVSSLRKKLDSIDAPVVRTVHGQGYLLEPELASRDADERRDLRPRVDTTPGPRPPT